MNSLRRVHEVDFKTTDPCVSRKGYQEILRSCGTGGTGKITKNSLLLKGGINLYYTRYNSYSRDKSAILGITIPGIEMGSLKHYLSLE